MAFDETPFEDDVPPRRTGAELGRGLHDRGGIDRRLQPGGELPLLPHHAAEAAVIVDRNRTRFADLDRAATLQRAVAVRDASVEAERLDDDLVLEIVLMHFDIFLHDLERLGSL